MQNLATLATRIIIGLSGLFLALAPVESHAEGLGGSFAGEVTQVDPPITFRMEMNLYGSNGNINYPSLNCGGNLQFVNSDGTSFWYRENLTYGEDRCIDGGMIEMRRHALGGDTNWDWRWTGGGTSARGVVYGSGVAEQ